MTKHYFWPLIALIVTFAACYLSYKEAKEKQQNITDSYQGKTPGKPFFFAQKAVGALKVKPDQPSDDFSILESEWVSEVNQLGREYPTAPLYVRIWWSFGEMTATVFPPLADEQSLQIPLRPQSPLDLADGVIIVSLPKLGQGQFRKRTSTSGEVLLTMFYPIGTPPRALDWTEVHLCTNLDFLYLVTSEAPKE